AQGGQGKDGNDGQPVGAPASRPYKPQDPDAELRRLIGEIDRTQLQATVEALVGFGTRHTLSSQTDPTRGIGAATNYVFNQLESFAAASGGHMTVQRQSFVQPVSADIPVPTTITDVNAILTGAVAPARTYVIAAHLDSRVTDILDFTSDA